MIFGKCSKKVYYDFRKFGTIFGDFGPAPPKKP